jgi:hypothetical protein
MPVYLTNFFYKGKIDYLYRENMNFDKNPIYILRLYYSFSFMKNKDKFKKKPA